MNIKFMLQYYMEVLFLLKNINELKNIDLCDGFLIGGASLKHKNFIDIIKKYYN